MLSQIEHLLSPYLELTPPPRGPECPEYEILADYVEGNVSGDAEEELLAHLGQCEACSYLVARMQYWAEATSKEYSRSPWKFSPWTILPSAVRRDWKWQAATYAFAGCLLLCLALGIGFYVRGKGDVAQTPSIKIAKSTEEAGRQRVRVSSPVTKILLRGPGGEQVEMPIAVRFRYRSHGTSEIRESPLPLSAPLQLSSGDAYGFTVQSSRDGWLYVFHVDSEGRLILLFPSSQYPAPGNPLRAGHEYFIPPDETWYSLDRAEGTEVVYIAFSEARYEDWEEQFLRYQAQGDRAIADNLISELLELAAGATAGPMEGRTCVALQFQYEPSEP